MANNDEPEDWGGSDDKQEPFYRTPPAFWGDRKFYRILLYILGLIAVLSIIGVFALALKDKDAPDAIVALGSTALGALAGLIARGHQ